MKQKVMIGWPCGSANLSAFTRSILALQKFEMAEPSDTYELVSAEPMSGLYVQENRNKLVERARMAGVDWLLQLDDDESFPPTLLRQLMKTADAVNRPMVVGLYSNIVSVGEDDGGVLVVDMIFAEQANGEYTNMVPPSDVRPFMVDAAGSGVMLTHMRIFEAIQFPWFWLDLIQPSGKDSPQIINEDIAFCRLVREAGFKIWCDPLAEATHHKLMALVPSTFRRFLDRANAVHAEMARVSGS